MRIKLYEKGDLTWNQRRRIQTSTVQSSSASTICGLKITALWTLSRLELTRLILLFLNVQTATLLYAVQTAAAKQIIKIKGTSKTSLYFFLFIPRFFEKLTLHMKKNLSHTIYTGLNKFRYEVT